MQVRIAMAMRPADPNILYNAACTYGVLGMKADALDAFRRSVEAGYSNADWCSQDPDLKILHDDPEFKKLVAKGERKTGLRSPPNRAALPLHRPVQPDTPKDK